LRPLQQRAVRAPPARGPATPAHARVVDPAVFARRAPGPPDTGALAAAARRVGAARALLTASRKAPLVLLEEPTHLGNMGAVVRVAAAAGAAGVVTTGRHDPWGPDALRGGAGLQFAVPVAQIGRAHV